MGKKSRDKGARIERELVHILQECGIAAEKMPLSGACGGSFAGDVSMPALGIDRRVEVKCRANGFKKIYDWLADHYALAIRADRQPVLMIVRADDFALLLQTAERKRFRQVADFQDNLSVDEAAE